MGSIFKTIENPLVLSPIVGAILVMLGVHLPDVLIESLQLLGSAASGVAVFASGLTLAAHRFAAKPAVFTGTFVKIIVQPAIFAALLICLWDQPQRNGTRDVSSQRHALGDALRPFCRPI
jgi:malonate transporter and related proteins